MLELARGVWPGTLSQLRDCGRGRNECVVFWTGPAVGPGVVDHIEHPEHTATPGHYTTDEDWLHRFWVALHREGRTARAQVHTHGGAAFHSRTDDAYALVRSRGFLSLVVPDFAQGSPPADRLYLTEMDAGGRWREEPIEQRIRELI